MNSELTYSEAIEKVLLGNGYFAPLSLIYRDITKYRSLTGKTPFKTIQERVQRDSRFTRIGVGIYALTNFLDRLQKAEEPKQKEEKIEYQHARIQGMLLEMGELYGFSTYTNDKSKIFDGKKLGLISSLKECPPFTYPEIIQQSVRFFDVVWFNARGFPHRIFEVENSTDFRGAFVKFVEMQDFFAKFFVIAPDERKIKFELESGKRAFESVKERCKFQSYGDIEKSYENLLAYSSTKGIFD